MVLNFAVNNAYFPSTAHIHLLWHISAFHGTCSPSMANIYAFYSTYSPSMTNIFAFLYTNSPFMAYIWLSWHPIHLSGTYLPSMANIFCGVAYISIQWHTYSPFMAKTYSLRQISVLYKTYLPSCHTFASNGKKKQIICLFLLSKHDPIVTCTFEILPTMIGNSW